MELFTNHFAAVKAVGLGITLHIAEVLVHLSLRESVSAEYKPGSRKHT